MQVMSRPSLRVYFILWYVALKRVGDMFLLSWQIRLMQNRQELRLAVLIDADNVPSANLKEMMEEIAKYGTPTFKRIYGDWTKPTVGRWKTLLLENAITPIQQYSYTQGKNAT